jgi:glutaminase
MAGTLANGGVYPLSGKRLLEKAYVSKILAEMAVEGLYDASGTWKYDVGLPQRAALAAESSRSFPGIGRSRPFLRRWMRPATACEPSSRLLGLPIS